MVDPWSTHDRPRIDRVSTMRRPYSDHLSTMGRQWGTSTDWEYTHMNDLQDVQLLLDPYARMSCIEAQ